MAIYPTTSTLDDFGRLRRTPLYTDGRSVRDDEQEQERLARAATAPDAQNIIAQALASLLRDLDYQPPLPGMPEYQAAQPQVDLGPDPGPHFKIKSDRGGFLGALETVGRAILAGAAGLDPNFTQRLALDRQYHEDVARAQQAAQQQSLEQAVTLEKIRDIRRQQKLDLLKAAKDLMPKQEPDKHIGQYTNEQGQQVVIMQRPDGSVYETPLGRIYRDTKEPTSPSAGLMSPDPAVRARAIQALRTEKQIEQQFRPTDTGPAISKDAIAAAQGKLINIGLAKKQLADVEAAIDKLGPADLTGLTSAGKAFDAAVSGLRQTFTAITRVPGLGSMSDYETRLAQAPLPGRGDLYREVMKQKTAQIRMMLDELESGYRSQLGGQAQPAPAPKPAPRSGSGRPASADEFLRKWGLSR